MQGMVKVNTWVFILRRYKWHIHAGSWSLVNCWREGSTLPYKGCSWILMNAAVGLMDGLGLDGDRCIRVIPRQASMLQQCYNDTSNIPLIENNGVAPDWDCNPFSSDYLLFSLRAVSLVSQQHWHWRSVQMGPHSFENYWRMRRINTCTRGLSIPCVTR